MVAGEAIAANLLPELIFLMESLVETLEALRAQARREKDA
jgi:hypothetical protein